MKSFQEKRAVKVFGYEIHLIVCSAPSIHCPLPLCPNRPQRPLRPPPTPPPAPPPFNSKYELEEIVTTYN